MSFNREKLNVDRLTETTATANGRTDAVGYQYYNFDRVTPRRLFFAQRATNAHGIKRAQQHDGPYQRRR